MLSIVSIRTLYVWKYSSWTGAGAGGASGALALAAWSTFARQGPIGGRFLRDLGLFDRRGRGGIRNGA